MNSMDREATIDYLYGCLVETPDVDWDNQEFMSELLCNELLDELQQQPAG